MNITQSNIYPVSQARNMFSRLVDEVKKSKAFFVTKKGKIKAALVDIEYLQKMQKDLETLYKKTFIDKNLLPYTREFTDEEIKEWQEGDKL
ncbi:type II toxin-antitoxin system Phd/YefM family antitoxin [Candidatus Roizmanbacteria bacterium]|nr:type II toxin-antitoxin system Phd/YefM family antitoxin [Candidatus Roizmanbacteria bacterium]